MEIVSVRSELTQWDEEGRIQGNTDVPLSEAGVERARRTGSDLAGLGVRRVYSGTSLPVYQTASIVCEASPRAAVRRKQEFDEVDFGLWQGLLELDLRRKHRDLYQKWLASPESIEPPYGERLDEAYERLVAGVEEIMRGNPKRRVMLVTGPFAYSLVACYFRDLGLRSFWDVHGETGKRWELYAV